MAALFASPDAWAGFAGSAPFGLSSLTSQLFVIQRRIALGRPLPPCMGHHRPAPVQTRAGERASVRPSELKATFWIGRPVPASSRRISFPFCAGCPRSQIETVPESSPIAKVFALGLKAAQVKCVAP